MGVAISLEAGGRFSPCDITEGCCVLIFRRAESLRPIGELRVVWRRPAVPLPATAAPNNRPATRPSFYRSRLTSNCEPATSNSERGGSICLFSLALSLSPPPSASLAQLIIQMSAGGSLAFKGSRWNVLKGGVFFLSCEIKGASQRGAEISSVNSRRCRFCQLKKDQQWRRRRQ